MPQPTRRKLHQHPRTRLHVNKWKVKNIRGQRYNTRARALQHQINVKVHTVKLCYCHGCRAYLALAGPGPWTLQYKELQDDNCRAMNERELTQKEKEERREKIQSGEREVGDTQDGIVVTGAMGTRRVLW